MPILQIGITSESRPEQELYDLGFNFVRTQLATIRGAAVPLPYGGRVRQIMVDSDPAGRVVRTANALDAASRTLLVEVQVLNREGTLLPGMYALVDLALDPGAAPLSVPATALIVDSAGTQVATVDSGGRIRLMPVGIARDYGARLEISGEVPEGARVVLNPTEELRDGQVVRLQPEPAATEPTRDRH